VLESIKKKAIAGLQESRQHSIADGDDSWILHLDLGIETIRNATKLTPIFEILQQSAWDCGTAFTMVMQAIEPDIDANRFAWRSCWDS